MDEQEKTEAAKEEETADETTAADTTKADEDQSKSTEDELDFDKEIEEERKRGKPDPVKAGEAFKKREANRKSEDDEEEVDDEDKPLTRKDIAEIEARSYARAQSDRALELARAIAGSDKEATLIFEKWRNRTFPAGLPLQQQIEEAYVITHSKKMIGERNESLRALKAKGNTTKVAPSSHQDAQKGGEPKMSDADRQGYITAGYTYDSTKGMYKKPLKGGRLHLYKDPRTGRTFTAA